MFGKKQKKNVVSDFAYLLTAITNHSFPYGKMGTRLCPRLILRFSQYFLTSLVLNCKKTREATRELTKAARTTT